MLMALSVFLMCLSSVVQSLAQESGENYAIDLPGKVKLEMIWIEPGTFKMGAPKLEIEHMFGSDGEIQHEVTLTKEYWLGKYEVTQEQWNAVMGSNRSSFKGEKLPVTNVTWDEVMEFCEELTKMGKKAGNLPEGYKYTLPTEAQWEYACRAGTRTSLNSGKNVTFIVGECPNLDKVGWYIENSRTPHPVGKKEANAWGLHDMHGNVCEYCLDWSGDYPTSSVTDPKGPSKGSYRVVRGGSWRDVAFGCRSACRSNDGMVVFNGDYLGFRVALAPIQ